MRKMEAFSMRGEKVKVSWKKRTRNWGRKQGKPLYHRSNLNREGRICRK